MGETFLEFITILLIAIGLAMDCFAVSLGIGCTPIQKDVRTIFRITFHFGLFQGLMTYFGWLAGSSIASLIERFDHWIAFALLAWVGARMIKESFANGEKEDPCNPSRGKTLVMLSLATSIDALAVGLSLALVNGSIVFDSLLIGAISLLFSLAGLAIGNRLGCKFGKRMELVGGLVLVGIGIRVLLSHLLG